MASTEIREQLRAAADRGDTQAVSSLLDQSMDIGIEDLGDVLYAAVSNGRNETVALLLDRGVSVNAKNEYGDPALHQAVSHGHIETVTLLLDRGADVHATGKHGEPALQWAATSGNNETVALLLDRGADVHATNKYGDQAFLRAVSSGCAETAVLLLDRGADVHATNNVGEGAIHWAATNGRGDLVALLLGRGVDFNATTMNGDTALHSAATNGHADTLALLLDQGTDVNVKKKSGATALHLAAWNGHAKAVELLLDRGADIHAKTEDGDTALRWAASNGYAEMLALLLDHGADVDVTNKDGETALHRAAWYGHADAVALLLDRGANIHVMDKLGVSPLGTATDARYTNAPNIVARKLTTVKLLCDHGALWDTSCERPPENASDDVLAATGGLRACANYWIRQREQNPSAALIDVPVENVEGGKDSVESYLKRLQETAAEDILYRRKVCVIGASFSGKTSLIQSLEQSRPVMIEVEDRTIGIDLFKLELERDASLNARYEATLWDFAGQDIYQAAHTLYFSKRTSYLVLVNSELYADQIRESTKLSTWVQSSVFSWLQLVLGRQPDAELVFALSKHDKIDAVDMKRIEEDLVDRLAVWATDFEKQHDGHIHAAIKKSVSEFRNRRLLHVSVVGDHLPNAIDSFRDMVLANRERAYPMPLLYTKVLAEVRRIQIEASESGVSVDGRLSKLLVDVDNLVRELTTKIDDLKDTECRDILRTFHALGDVLWFDELRLTIGEHMKKTLILDPKILIDIVREVVNHDRSGSEYEALLSRGELAHSVLSQLPLWDSLCIQNPSRVLYLKQLLKHFHLAYPVGANAATWEADLVVPSYWNVTKQPAITRDVTWPSSIFDVSGTSSSFFAEEALWQYTVPSNVSRTVFDQFVVQCQDESYVRAVVTEGVLMWNDDALGMISYCFGAKEDEDSVLIRTRAGKKASTFHVLKMLVLAMEHVLAGYPGLGRLGRHFWRKNKSGTGYEAVSMDRVAKSSANGMHGVLEKIEKAYFPAAA